jgi:hypothetical protein
MDLKNLTFLEAQVVVGKVTLQIALRTEVVFATVLRLIPIKPLLFLRCQLGGWRSQKSFLAILWRSVSSVAMRVIPRASRYIQLLVRGSRGVAEGLPVGVELDSAGAAQGLEGFGETVSEVLMIAL